MFSKQDPKKNQYMLTGKFRKHGYDWWWHSFTGVNKKTGEEKAFFAEFFIINPALGGKEPVLGQKKENKENHVRPSYLMVKCGCWGNPKMQLHRFFGMKDVSIDKGVPFAVKAMDCYLDTNQLDLKVDISEDEAKAHPEWMSDAGHIEMHLKCEKKIAYNVGYGAGGFFRAIKAFQMYWHAEGMKTLYSGTVTVNGEEYEVTPERSYGYQDKNWGSDFTTPWVWLSSNSLTSNITGRKLENTVFDIGGGRPKVFFIALNRKLLGGIYHEGKEYEFNFSKFWTGSKTEFECHSDSERIYWHVVQSTRKYIMDTTVECDLKDMLLVNYEDPLGMKRHNHLYNGGTGVGRILLYEKKGKEKILIDDMKATRIGCEYGEFDEEAQKNN